MRRARIVSIFFLASLAACSTASVESTATTPVAAEESTTQPSVATTTTTTLESTTIETMSLPDGDREFAFVTDVDVKNDGTIVVTADYARFLSGQEAIDAAAEAGELDDSGTLPNDFYIVNENSRLRELTLAPDAPVALYCFVDGECNGLVEVSVGQWMALLDGEVPPGLSEGFQWYGAGLLPYWLILDGQIIVGIEEQYLP